MPLIKIYGILYGEYGPQHWWPGDSPWEIAAGAVLTQNTNWGNVEKAISNLKIGKLLDPDRIATAKAETIQDAIRPAGYFRLKTGRLKNLARWWLASTRDDQLNCRKEEITFWRNSLLSVNGIGRETADSILLYSFNLPTFVIDAYTRRIVSRHCGIPESLDYDEMRGIFMEELPRGPALFNEFHALLVRLGKEACIKKGCTGRCILGRSLPQVPRKPRIRNEKSRK